MKAFDNTFRDSEGALEIRDSPNPIEAFYLLAKRNFSKVVLRAVLGRELDFSQGTCWVGTVADEKVMVWWLSVCPSVVCST